MAPTLPPDDIWDTHQPSRWFDDMLEKMDKQKNRMSESFTRPRSPKGRIEKDWLNRGIKAYENYKKNNEKKSGFLRRLRKMSKSDFSIPLLPLIIVGYFLFSGDDDEDTSQVTETKSEPAAIVETAKEATTNAMNDAMDKLQPVIDEAKQKFENEKEKVIVKKSDPNDPYKQNSDRYDSLEDKW